MLDLCGQQQMPHATTFEPIELLFTRLHQDSKSSKIIIPRPVPTFDLSSVITQPYIRKTKPSERPAMTAAAARSQAWAASERGGAKDGHRRSTSGDLAAQTRGPLNYHTQGINGNPKHDQVLSVVTDVFPERFPTTSSARSVHEGSVSPIEAPISKDMRIPTSITTPQISIPQLAAEVTCLFWFESGSVLKQVESLSTTPTVPYNYVPDARPTVAFKKWVHNILSTTQVKPNVVLLALLFIYRLKCANLTVKGKPGSEYRLLTVALMLGNKFLDDNTYTNKTWADVSGIPAQEVHVMEVEFLSNMRYTLFVSEIQWAQWLGSVGKFGSYIASALRYWDNTVRPAAALQFPPRIGTNGLLPSPPVSSSASPQVFAHLAPSTVGSARPMVFSQLADMNASTPAQFTAGPAKRKRSYDEAVQEPATKRQSRPNPASYPTSAAAHSSSSPAIAQFLPAVSTPGYMPSLTPNSGMSQLPQPAMRSLAAMYQHGMPTSQPVTMPPLQTNILPQPNLLRVDAARALSPYHIDSAGSSPLSASYSHATTPFTRLSPSFYLAQRSSPYKPVRRPHTLLAPPPNMALHNPARQVSDEQMQYHSLGRPLNEVHHGHIPYQPQSHYYYPPLPPLVHSAGQRHL